MLHYRPRVLLTCGTVFILFLALVLGMPRAVQGIGVTSTPPQQVLSGTSAASPLAAAALGQIAHIVVKETEQKTVPEVTGGPPHADRAYLFPDTVVGETWVVVGPNNTLDRAITYTNDTAGKLVVKAVIDSQGTTTLHNFRQDLTVVSKGTPPSVRDFDSRPTDLQSARASGKYTQSAQTTVAGRDAVVLREQATGKQYSFDRQTGGLLRAEAFASDGTTPILTTEWQTIEVLDAKAVPHDVLSTDLPYDATMFRSIPSRQLSRQDAAKALPFTLYTIDGLPDPLVNAPTGTRVDPAAVPLPYRGIDAVVQRGDGVGFAYRDGATKQYIEVREAPTDRFTASLKAALPFWDNAKQITVQIGGKSVSGWYLTSTVQVRDGSSGNSVKNAPGPNYIVLPDVNGTGISLMSQSYSESEFVALAQRLHV